MATNARQAVFSPAVVSTVFVLWLCVVIGLFWLFQFRYESVWVSFEGDRLPKVEANGTMKVVHFVDETCPCSKFTKPHIVDIENRWAGSGVRFETLDMSENAPVNDAMRQVVPATPAVAVWNPDGELAYFGPYTSGAICGEGEDLLEQVLNTSAKGQRTNQESVGCFCQRFGQTS